MPKSRVHCSMGFQFLVMSNLGSLFLIICSRWSLKTQVIVSLWQIYTHDLIMEELWRLCTADGWDLIRRIGGPLTIPWTCLEHLMTHGPESVANEFRSEKDVKEKMWKTFMWSLIVQVTDESVEYLKSGSAVFSVLRNLGKSEERVLLGIFVKPTIRFEFKVLMDQKNIFKVPLLAIVLEQSRTH